MQNVSFEELFPNVSNYVNSSEIVPVSSWQESSSSEVTFSDFSSIAVKIVMMMFFETNILYVCREASVLSFVSFHVYEFSFYSVHRIF